MPDDTPKQLSAEDFAAQVKAKYPAYAKMPDQELTAKILEKYPEYQKSVMAPGVAEARKQVTGPINKMISSVDAKPMSAYSIFQPEGVSTKPKGGQLQATPEQVEKVAGLQRQVTESTLGAVGGEAVAGVKFLAAAPKAVQILSKAFGVGAGGATGSLASGQGPKEAAKTGGMFTVIDLGFAALGPAWKVLSRMWQGDPLTMLKLSNLADVGKTTIKDVQEGAAPIRKMISATYPEVESPVRIMPAAKVAQKAEAGMVAEAAPKQVSRVADIGRARQQQALRLLSRARQVMENSPEGAGEEVSAILNKAKDLQGISFKDAQKLYSSLGRAAAKGVGWKLSGEQIHALTEARDALEFSMKDALEFETQMGKTAKASGVMPEGELGEFYRFRDSETGGSFSVRKSEYSAEKLSQEAEKLRRSIPDTTQLDPLAQQKAAGVRERFEKWQPEDKVAKWESAQARHRQFIEDFYKPGGALTKIMDADPEEFPAVMEHLLADPNTRTRATAALNRWGFDTAKIQKLALEYRDATLLRQDLAAAARLEQLGQEAFGVQEAAATRSRVGKKLLKAGTTAAKIGLGYELYKALDNKPASLKP